MIKDIQYSIHPANTRRSDVKRRKLERELERRGEMKRGDGVKEFVVTLGQALAYPDSYNIPIGCRIKINKGI